MAENYEQLESSTGVPADILQRSADARADADGKTTDGVIADWTGGEAPAQPEAPAAAAAEAAVAAPAEAAGLPAVESLAGEALIAAAAEAKGIPVSLVERSAQARADADRVPVEQVMRQWVVEAGLATVGAAVAAPAPAAPAPPPEPAAPAPPPEPAASAEPAAPAEPATPTVEVLEPTEPIEELADEQVEPEPPGRYPAWLAAALVIIPLLAVLYVVVVPNQPSCGSAGQVGVDPATGAHANCDGSVPYGAVEETPVLLGGVVYEATCAVCHGDAGQGAAGPALAGGAVLETFPEGMCATHRQWVTLGSIGWPDPTYGATNKPVQGGMPPAVITLTEEEIAQVALYERVVHGGEDEETAETDCGFNEEGEFVTEVVASG